MMAKKGYNWYKMNDLTNIDYLELVNYKLLADD